MFAVLLYGCIFDAGGGPGDENLAIQGYVRDELGRSVEAVTMNAYLSYEKTVLSTPTYSVQTDSRGFYRIPFGRSLIGITVLPAKDDCVFRPPKVSYYRPTAPMPNENFTAVCGELHTIRGRVLDNEEDPVTGVAITIRDDLPRWDKTVFTDAGGSYTITNIVPDLNYVVTPLLSSYEFVPPVRTYENLNCDFEDQDFTAIVESFPGSGPTE